MTVEQGDVVRISDAHRGKRWRGETGKVLLADPRTDWVEVLVKQGAHSYGVRCRFSEVEVVK